MVKIKDSKTYKALEEEFPQPAFKDAFNTNFLTSDWQLIVSVMTAWQDKTPCPSTQLN
jgi:hypothetical protein